jgi:hypothetical protein
MTSEISHIGAAGQGARSASVEGTHGGEAHDNLVAAAPADPRLKLVKLGVSLRRRRNSTLVNTGTPHQIPLPVHPGPPVPIPTTYPCVPFPVPEDFGYGSNPLDIR